MRRCTFLCLDVFAFLDRFKDAPKHGLYLDPPFPGAGDAYRHKFTTAHHHQLAARLGGFYRGRVVVRYYDHPMIRQLYPERDWAWHLLTGGKTQTNAAAPEVLIVRRNPDEPCATCNGSGMPGGVSGFGACPGCNPDAAAALAAELARPRAATFAPNPNRYDQL